MKLNKWTVGLAAVGVVSLASAARADETPMSQVQTALSNTTLSGYVDTSVMWNPGTQNGGYLPPYTPGGVHGDGFNLNAVDIALDKPMDESPWAAGYHVELMMGQDSVGETFSSSSTTGAAIRQAYLSLRTPIGAQSINWKFGAWDSPIGYESASDPLNPNYTRSYGWQIEPTTFTGLLGTYKVNDMVQIQAGVANSSTTGANDLFTSGNAVNGQSGGEPYYTYESQKAYLGDITFTAPDSWGWAKGGTLTLGAINADSGSSPYGTGRTWLYAGVTSPTPLNALKVGLAYDFLDRHTAAPVYGDKSDDSVWDVAAYANYQINDKASLNLRGEYLDASHNDAIGMGVLGDGHTGEEVTATLQYNLWANVLSRVELRWDRQAVRAFDNGQAGEGYDTHVHQNELLLAANLIYQF